MKQTLCARGSRVALDMVTYDAMTRRNEAWVAREFPELLDELHGVAEGSGIDYADLLHLNLNTDVAYARAYALVLDCTRVRWAKPGRTYAATVICPQEQTMWTAFGNPCEGMQAVGRPGE